MKIEETFSEKYLRFQKSQGIKSVYGIGCGELNCTACALHRDRCEENLCRPANAEKLVEFINDWANRNTLEREIDWSKVPIDTPVMVANCDEKAWTRLRFAMYLPERDCRFMCFRIAEERKTALGITFWKQCKLVEDNPAYYTYEED